MAVKGIRIHTMGIGYPPGPQNIEVVDAETGEQIKRLKRVEIVIDAKTGECCAKLFFYSNDFDLDLTLPVDQITPVSIKDILHHGKNRPALRAGDEETSGQAVAAQGDPLAQTGHESQGPGSQSGIFSAPQKGFSLPFSEEGQSFPEAARAFRQEDNPEVTDWYEQAKLGEWYKTNPARYGHLEPKVVTVETPSDFLLPLLHRESSVEAESEDSGQREWDANQPQTGQPGPPEAAPE